MKPILYWKVGKKLFTDYEEARKFESGLVASKDGKRSCDQIQNKERGG